MKGFRTNEATFKLLPTILITIHWVGVFGTMSLSQKYEVEILPAILVKDRSHFLEQIEIVKP